MQVFEPGTYEHTCPACGYKTVFTVHGHFLMSDQIPQVVNGELRG